MFRSLIHFEFIFVYGVRKCSSFILLHMVDWFSQHLNQFYEVDETGTYYTEGTKSEREPSIHYINAYIWTLERR